MTTLAELWVSYRDACYPEGASETQLRETRQAFFGGAMVALAAVSAASELPENEAIEVVQKYFEEATKACSEQAIANFYKGN